MNIKKQNLLSDDEIKRPANNTLVTIIVIGIALIIVAYVVPKNLREEAEKELKLEEGITAALNEQNLAVKKLADERKAAQEERELNHPIVASPPFPVQSFEQPRVQQQRIVTDITVGVSWDRFRQICGMPEGDDDDLNTYETGNGSYSVYRMAFKPGRPYKCVGNFTFRDTELISIYR